MYYLSKLLPGIRKLMLAFVLLLSFTRAEAKRIYADSANTASPQDGSNWGRAYSKFDSALNIAIAGDTIWVASGTYRPSSTYSFVMKEGVAIYGGFANTDTVFSQRNWNTRLTTLRGNGRSVINNAFTAGYPMTGAAVLDGFTITGGEAGSSSGMAFTRNGGGMANTYASPTITNVIFSANTAKNGGLGGGMYNFYSSPVFTNVRFISNVATYSSGTSGGGMYNLQSTPTLINVVFENNQCNASSGIAQGGAMFNGSSSPRLTNVIFSMNFCAGGTSGSAYAVGGAVANYSNSAPIYNKVVFSRNYCLQPTAITYTFGGAVYNVSNGTIPSLFTNVVFSENSASNGPAMYNENSTNTLTNVTFYNNSYAKGFSYGHILDRSATLNLTNCLFNPAVPVYSISSIAYTVNNSYANSAFTGSTGAGNKISTVIPFTDNLNPEGPDGIWMTADDGLRLKNGLAISPVDGGITITTPAGVATEAASDINGTARPQGSAYDIGAYEGGFTKTRSRYYVDSANSSGIHNGLSWATAYDKLEDALRLTGADDTVWVTRGTYSPVTGTSFTMSNGTAIYGGFKNTDTAFTQRNHVLNKSVLAGNGSSVIWNDYSAKSKMANSSVLDGFIITGGSGRTELTGTVLCGGGIYNNNASPSFNNLVIYNNAAGQGGGMYNSNAAPLVTNTVFYANTASQTGGAVMNQAASSPYLYNITYVKNAASDGGALYNINTSSPRVVNSIFWANTGTIPDISNVNSSSPVVTYSLTQSAAPDATSIKLTASPFINEALPAGPDGTWMTADDGLQLNYSAPVSGINMGFKVIGSDAPTNMISTNAVLDILKTPRVNSKPYDMGAYEYPLMVTDRYYVDSANVTGTHDGRSWATAYNKLEDALTAYRIAAGDTVWVAKGTYSPAASQSYVMPEGVKILGGFLNTDTTISKRNWTANKTILKGNGNSVIKNSSSAVSRAAVLDGFTVTGGSSNSGGGISNVSASPTLRNLVVTANTASLYGGGGIYSYACSPLIINVTVMGNVGTGWGAGIENSMANPEFRNVIISQNRTVNSTASGGGMYNWNSSPILDKVVFDRNTAGNQGGGLFVQNATSFPVLSNVIFYANTANSGGAIYSSGIMRVRNATFSKNVSLVNSAVFSNTNPVNLPVPDSLYSKVSNCVFWDNSVAGTLGDISIVAGHIANCYFQLAPGAPFGVSTRVNNIVGSASPFISSDMPRGADSLWFTGDDGLQLNFCSAALNAGNTDSVADLTTDIIGRPRVKNAIVDMGAYEKQSNTTPGQFSSNTSLSTGSSNAMPFLQVCDDSSWTFYANPVKPDSLSFAINWGTGNNLAKAAAVVYLQVDAANTNVYNASGGHFTMRRYWNVDLKGTTLVNPVQVRFYFDAADTASLRDSAIAAGFVPNAVSWFKTTDTLYRPSQVNALNINNGNQILLQPVYGKDNNVTYVQFKDIMSFSGGTAVLSVGAGAPLPITLLNFKASKNIDNRSVRTSWQVAHEDLATYEVQRSADAINFETAGNIKATGKSSYVFNDVLYQHQDAVRYYKLKMIDKSGRYSFSKTEKVTFDAQQDGMTTIAPNPSNSTVMLHNTNAALNGREVVVSDAVGRLVQSFTMAGQVVLNISTWQSGIYFVKLPDGTVLKMIRE